MPETQLFTPYWRLPANYIDGITTYDGTTITHFHLVAEGQVTGALKIFGPGVATHSPDGSTNLNSLEVTDAGGGYIAIAPGAGVLIDATYGPTYFELATTLNIPISGASPKYIYPVYVVAPDGTTEDSHETGLVQFVASATAPPTGTNSLATVPFSGSTIGEIVDTRVFLNASSDPRALIYAESYDATITYAKNELVKSASGLYRSKVDSNLNHTPASSATQWELFPPVPDQAANTVFRGPTSGANAAPVFGALVAADIPSLAISKTTGLQTALDAKASGTDLATEIARATAAEGDVASDLADHEAEASPHSGHFDVDGSKPLTGDADAGGFKWTNGAPGTDPNDAVIVSQLETVGSGFNPVRQVRVGTLSSTGTFVALPANSRTGDTLTATSNGSINATGIDGIVDLTVNDDVAVMGESVGANRGIYSIDVVGSAGVPWSMTRRADFNESSEVATGARFSVREGAYGAGTAFYVDTPGTITVNTTSISFSQDSRSKGEINTAADGAIEGVSIVGDKTGTVLGFFSLADPDSLISIVRNAATKSVRFSLNLSSILLQNLGGVLTVAQGGTGGTTSAAAKTNLGLNNVTNDAQVKRSEMGANSGVATLDSGGKVPTAQLPDTATGSYLPLAGGVLTGPVTGVASTGANSLTTLSQLQAITLGLFRLAEGGAVRVATTGNITLSGLQTIDTVSVLVGNRVLVKNQTTPSENGIYVAASGAWARATDANTGAELLYGLGVGVLEGTAANTDFIWVQSKKTSVVTIGSTPIIFTNNLKQWGVGGGGSGGGTLGGARVYNSVDQTNIGGVGWAPLTFDSEEYDTASFHSTVTNPERLTIPTTGVFMVGGQVDIEISAGIYFFLRVTKNGSSDIAMSLLPAAVTYATRININTIVSLTAGDYLTLEVYQDSGTDKDILHTADLSPYFWIEQMR